MDLTPAPAGRPAGKELAFIGIILAAAFLLRVFRLDFDSFWLDESISVITARSPFWEILTSPRLDSQPPLFDLILHFWQRLGSQEFLLRFPSVIFGVLSVALLYRLARSLFGPALACLAALLLTVSPLHVWYSQEVRSYALVALCGLASAYFFTRVLSGGRRSYWLAYVAVTVAGLYANYSVLLLLACQNIYLAVYLWRSGRYKLVRPWLIAQASLALGFAPWLPFILDSLEEASRDHQTLLTVGRLFERLWLNLGRFEVVLMLLALTFLVALLILAVRVIWPRRSRLLQDPVARCSFILASYVVLTALSALPQGLSVKRHLLVLLPFALLALALGAGQLKLPRVRLILIALLIALPGLSVNYFFNPKEQWREAARVIEDGGRPGDLVLVNAFYMTRPFSLYYRGELPFRGVPYSAPVNGLKKDLPNYQRVWLVLSQEKYFDPTGSVQEWFGRCQALQSRSQFAHVTVDLYQIDRRACPD